MKNLNIQFKYAKHIDLVFHVLAHMQVNNASDLYSQEYIDKFKLLRNNKELFIPYDIVEYYNIHFNNVGMINFLPFYSKDFDELKHLILNYNGFTDDDINLFVKPFLSICENESDFYFDFWKNKINIIKDECVKAENIIREKLDLYSCIFDYYNKSALAFLSLSITRNGRGFGGIDNSFSALIPFPKSSEQVNNSFFVLLHEYTHQITDELLKTNINMEDGSHDISENMVILFDFYLIKSLNKADVEKYLEWISEILGITDNKITETTFLSVFNVKKSIREEIDNLLYKIIGSNR